MVSNLLTTPSFDKALRTLDAIAAIGNNVLEGSLDTKIFYLHLHKCGGTSIAQAIKACYQSFSSIIEHNTFHLNGAAASSAARKYFEDTPITAEDNDYLIGKFRESLLLYYMCQPNINYIAGHFSFSEAAYQNFSDKYAFVTVLRNPVKRLISAYFYSQQEISKLSEEDLLNFLDSERALRGGYMYVKSIGGLVQSGDYTSEAAIKRAQENLHKFRLIGFLEHKEVFIEQFEQKFGRKLKIRNYNQNSKAKTAKQSLISEKIEAKIREICQPDMEVYEYALTHFLSR
ncbi:sulfotransferase family 2 domain-containing protein [Chroococcidiopsis sp. TS-821]|uniref:sulfotransferase family 2 domain-containing protein n=1 Tax=Chroococcidiopsis sp. TS-821 TaxID=1378066 RepID=UPI000CEE818D|nr:sulfotransferase family 2 domain-containing protein [Chroococcidiopsis sp. TS-821]PPS41155.1 hypothetical protein B1A85_17730 [Chroococcidiopsis sp. TS-821]